MEDLRLDHTTYSEYLDDLNYNQGFYVTPPEDGSVMLAGLRRVGVHSDERFLKAAECAAKFAMEECNKKTGKERFLKFDKVVNLNVEPFAGGGSGGRRRDLSLSVENLGATG